MFGGSFLRLLTWGLMERTSRVSVLVAVVFALPVLGGCSLLGGGSEPGSQGSSEPSEQQAKRMKVAATAKAPQPQHELASHTGTLDGKPVKATVTSLIRNGGTVTLSYTLRNQGNPENTDLFAQLDQSSLDAPGADGNESAGVTLVDGTHKKKYLVARDSKGKCLCTKTAGVTLQPGQTIGMSATFAAPPSSIDRINVELPNFETFYRIPVK